MKQTLISLAVILVATALCFGLIYERNTRREALIITCPTDVMMCPDGSTVARSGASCEFGVCKQENMNVVGDIKASTTPSLMKPDIAITSPTKKTEKIVSTSIFNKITSSATSLFKQAAGSINKNVSSGIKETTKTTAPIQNTVPSTPPSINETRYSVKDGKLVDQNNTVIYALPSPTTNSSGNGMETHSVNAVAVNHVAPVVGAIPVNGLPGKYYLSENSFGSIGGCEFANKIYILDTTTGIKTLLYEENNTLLATDDPRACNSEMYLLATENEKLILKYHTIGTNMTCDSTWSEPEKTWYLDVTQPEKGSRRYWISPILSGEAEISEAACRSSLDATTTP